MHEEDEPDPLQLAGAEVEEDQPRQHQVEKAEGQALERCPTQPDQVATEYERGSTVSLQHHCWKTRDPW